MISDYKLFDTIYCALLEFSRSLFQWILGQEDLYVQSITRSFEYVVCYPYCWIDNFPLFHGNLMSIKDFALYMHVPLENCKTFSLQHEFGRNSAFQTFSLFWGIICSGHCRNSIYHPEYLDNDIDPFWCSSMVNCCNLYNFPSYDLNWIHWTQSISNWWSLACKRYKTCSNTVHMAITACI